MLNVTIEVKRLKFFTVFEDLPDAQIQRIAESIKLAEYKPKQRIIAVDSVRTDYLLLLNGEVVLRAKDGGTEIIDHRHAKSLIAQLRPSKFDVIAKTRALIASFDPTLLENDAVDAVNYAIDEPDSALEVEENNILYELITTLKSDEFELPSLPDVATKIHQKLKDDNCSIQDIANIVGSDPAIAAKLIKTTNSPLYRRGTPVTSCQTAIVRLGLKTTTEMVTAYVLKEVFSSKSKLLNKRMRQLWKHSVDIAAISYVLAKQSKKFDPDHAMLAGLIHDIGIVGILALCADYLDVMNNSDHLNAITRHMHSEVGTTILNGWGFMPDLVEVAKGAQDWFRNEHPHADYADIVNLAHLHSYIGTAKQHKAPRIDAIPAYQKLKSSLGELTEQDSLAVLEESRDQIEQRKQLLRL